MTDDNTFERLNFFSGMFTTADDWNDGEDYHIRRLKLHHRGLHKPGVILGFRDKLEVNWLSLENGVFEFEVCPGAAIDSDGNIIYLASRKTVPLKAPEDTSKCSYVCIRFGEKPYRFVANDVQNDYSGHTRWAEDPIVEICDNMPDNLNLLELARIRLSPDATRIDPYKEGESSGENQIDRIGVQWSLSTKELEELLKKLDSRLQTEEHTSHEHGEHLAKLDHRVGEDEARLTRVEHTSHEHGEHLTKLDHRVGEDEARLTRVEHTSHEHGEHLAKLDHRVGEDEARLTRVEHTSDEHGACLDGHDAALGELDTRLATEETFSLQLDARLVDEETRSTEFYQRLETVERRCDNLEANLGVLADYGRLHYRGSHTLGVVPQEGEHLQVKAAGGLNVRVLTGAALDRAGNTLIVAQSRTLTIDLDSLHLPQLVFIAVHYDAARPENALLHVLTNLPAHEPWVELARIDLQPGVTHITDPADPASPGGNQIDRRSVPKSGAIAVREQGMSVTVVQRIVQVMGRSRRSFADLDMQFPTPSVSDARHVCLTVETMTRVGRLRLEQLADLMTTAATIEQDVSRELNSKYGKLLNTTVEFDAYMRAVRDLQFALRKHDVDAILAAQDEIAEAAHNLSLVAIEAPTANAGRDQEVVTYDDRVVVILDGSASQGRGGRTIEQHRWTVSAS